MPKVHNAHYAQPESLVAGQEMEVDGYAFRQYKLGKRGERAWLCPDLDIYVDSATSDVWVGETNIATTGRTPLSPLQAAKAGVAYALREFELMNRRPT